MPYVRDRLSPASKKHARLRTERNLMALALDPANPGARFPVAFDWFRAAAVYARRRSYRTWDARERAHARRAEILAAAAWMVQRHAEEMDAILPPPRQRVRRLDLKQACEQATDGTRMEAARQWFLFLAAQARREAGETAVKAAEIQGRAAEWFIRWAKEMDADDYGE